MDQEKLHQAKPYQPKATNGKGSKPRKYNVSAYQSGYEAINWKHKSTKSSSSKSS